MKRPMKRKRRPPLPPRSRLRMMLKKRKQKTPPKMRSTLSSQE
jgi:hypothetical protein